VADDPTNPREFYVASSMGLFRSTNEGRTFTNVALPTGECAGKTGYGRCQFMNYVTDVVVQEPGGVTNEKGGKVLAAVGYRAGMAEFPNGEVHSTHNGLYLSESGAPGTFEMLDVSGDGISHVGFAPGENIGRVELGVASGEKRDHNYLYAIVQDAELFNGGVPSIDVPEDPGFDDQALFNTVFNGIYVSEDFGQSWIRMADTAEVAENPTTHSGLAVVGQAQLFAPGVQAWYNMWIKPDPTQQTEDGVPTRLTFGLEEVWANRCSGPQNTPVQPPCDAPEVGDFEVIGPYFADEACLLLDTGQPTCPTAEDGVNTELTTHPDQHDALYLPTGDGGVSLIAGNDGGAYAQTLKGDEALAPTKWGEGNNDGFHTLLPYDAEVAKDGTVWYGLQDNGSGKILPNNGRQIMAFGGDGFFVAVDPNDSDVAYSETTFADMRVTTDGGKTWDDMPPPISNSKFSNPFVMDPTDAKHLMTAGKEVVETVSGPDTRCDDFGCDWQQVLNRNPETEPFLNGLATNVGGDQPPKRMTSQGWHHAKAKGLPNRYITSLAIDPQNPKTVYVALGGYANRQWVPPGSYLDRNQNITGHVFKSTDAGETFKNISGKLPNLSANWIEIHRGQLVVGTDLGGVLVQQHQRVAVGGARQRAAGGAHQHDSQSPRRPEHHRGRNLRAGCARTPFRARAGDHLDRRDGANRRGVLLDPPLRITGSARAHDVAVAARIGVVQRRHLRTEPIDPANPRRIDRVDSLAGGGPKDCNSISERDVQSLPVAAHLQPSDLLLHQPGTLLRE
jgi:hypothetical protein